MVPPCALAGNGPSETWIATEGAGTRTLDPRLKRPLLYRLSYTPNLLSTHDLQHCSRRATSGIDTSSDTR